MILALNSSVEIKYLPDPDALSWVLCDCKEEMPTIEYTVSSVKLVFTLISIKVFARSGMIP